MGRATASRIGLPAIAAPLRLRGIQFISAADGWAVCSRCVATYAPSKNCPGQLPATHDGGARSAQPAW